MDGDYLVKIVGSVGIPDPPKNSLRVYTLEFFTKTAVTKGSGTKTKRCTNSITKLVPTIRSMGFLVGRTLRLMLSVSTPI